MSRISITPQCIQAGLLSLALLLTPWTANQAFADGAGQHDPAALNLPSDYLLPLEELRTFAEVFERIKQAYVHPVSDAELLEYAIRGMLDGLDPHSSYMSPDAFQQLQESTQGEFGGLGIEITLNDGYIEIVSPIDDTPAAAAGLQAQDRILQIDGIAARNLPLDEAIDMMRGP
ncbi:S41 family peptidase, partial [Marinospirillum sp.]|uniref:S41 family peptidase n=1 Tax=Marinospirillum sp. TaxID=2183934 RepID=UPI003A885ADA